MQLETTTNRFADPDRAYRLLIDSHRGLTDEASAALNSRLILILANQIGSLDVLRAAIELAQSADTTGAATAAQVDVGRSPPEP
jgi:Protein of unknown function (DUF2783)